MDNLKSKALDFIVWPVVSSPLFAWLTHLIWAFSNEHETNGSIMLAIFGVIIPPIGIINGFVIWFTALGTWIVG